ncbi:MAG: hypothetical protein ACFHWX_13335 [Bacteroidota bacterium]
MFEEGEKRLTSLPAGKAGLEYTEKNYWPIGSYVKMGKNLLRLIR